MHPRDWWDCLGFLSISKWEVEHGLKHLVAALLVVLKNSRNLIEKRILLEMGKYILVGS